MTRSPLLHPSAAALIVAASLALAGCDRVSPPPAEAPRADPTPTPPPTPTPTPTPAPALATPAEPAPDEGWTRVDLSTLDAALTGTIDLPPGITAQVKIEQAQDEDGLTVDRRSIQIGDRVCGASLAPLAERAPRFASAAAMARFHGRFEHVETRELGPDHWAVVQRWRPGECMLHGWSGPAGLKCDVFKCPCGDMKPWIDVCASLRPGDAPNTVQSTAAAAFPELEPEAAEAAAKVARAIARDDAAALAAMVAPDGVKIGGEPMKGAALDARLKRARVIDAVSPEWVGMVGGSLHYEWNAPGLDSMKGRVFFSNGYGEIPYFDLAKIGADWRLAEFGIFDMGEP